MIPSIGNYNFQTLGMTISCRVAERLQAGDAGKGMLRIEMNPQHAEQLLKE